jgi:perosamine synthetase
MTGIGLARSDEVIVPDFTFPATANAVIHAGATPVLADIQESTLTLSPPQVRRAMSRRTKAIVVVHAFGHPAEMTALMKIAKENKLKLVEDAAGALGSTYYGRKVGTFGDVAAFSFHPRKIITTGEGGMLVTNNSQIAELATSLRNHGAIKRKGKIAFVRSGFNYRMTDFQAAIGLVQLREIRFRIAEARRLARRYARLLRGAKSIKCPAEEREVTHTYQAYCVMVSPIVRDRAIKLLARKGIETQLGYYALHMEDVFKKYRRAGPLTNSSNAFAGSLVLPTYSGMDDKDQQFVAKELLAVIGVK